MNSLKPHLKDGPTVSVLLIGARGAFGGPLLQELINQKHSFKNITILASNDEKAAKFAWARQAGITVRTGSFLESTSYEGITHVLCVVGNSLLALQPAMISAAITAGVTHFYPSEWNSDISQKSLYNMRYFREKQVTRTYLAAQARLHPHFKYTLFITGIFTEWSVLEFYGFDHEKREVIAYGSPDACVGLTAIPDIARYTVSSLMLPFSATNPNGSERTIRVTGTKTTHQGIVNALGLARGMNYTVQYRDPLEAAANEAKARLSGDEVAEMSWSIRPLLASGFGVADGNMNSALDNELFDFTPESMEMTFKRIYGGEVAAS